MVLQSKLEFLPDCAWITRNPEVEQRDADFWVLISEQHHSMNSSTAWRYPRFDSGDRKLFRTSLFA